MLPEKLSNGICSLNEGVVRLVLSCVMEIDPSGKMIDSSILSGYIKSKYRMTYSNVNKILEQADEKLINKYSDIYDMLLDMKELSRILRKKRTARGSLDFDVKEMKICVDETGKPINVLARDRGLAEMLIEDFMLEANETVAQTLYHLQYPCCYRVHEEPNKEKLNNVNNILKNIGYKIPNIDKGVRPMAIQSVMNKIKGSDSEDAINTMLLRAMAKARCDSRSLGHYGLAAEFYCHFTSPIRRYPDLQTHRMINNLIIKPHNFESKITHYQAILDYICERSSECERKSIDLERLVDDMKAAEYMENKIGNIYNGIISSVTSFGFFVMLDNTIEGLVHIKNLPDFYVYDEKKATLSGNYSKEVYNIGDTVKVRLIGASKENRQIDFMVVSHSKKRGL
jgi:ribonuclease R